MTPLRTAPRNSRTSHGRGCGDLPEYLCRSFPEKVKSIKLDTTLHRGHTGRHQGAVLHLRRRVFNVRRHSGHRARLELRRLSQRQFKLDQSATPALFRESRPFVPQKPLPELAWVRVHHDAHFFRERRCRERTNCGAPSRLPIGPQPNRSYPMKSGFAHSLSPVGQQRPDAIQIAPQPQPGNTGMALAISSPKVCRKKRLSSCTGSTQKHFVVDAPGLRLWQDLLQTATGAIVENEPHRAVGSVITHKHRFAAEPGIGQKGLREQKPSGTGPHCGIRNDFHAAMSHFWRCMSRPCLPKKSAPSCRCDFGCSSHC